MCVGLVAGWYLHPTAPAGQGRWVPALPAAPAVCLRQPRQSGTSRSYAAPPLCVGGMEQTAEDNPPQLMHLPHL